MNLTPRFSRDANVTASSNGWRLTIPAGEAGSFRLAQLDNYSNLPRGHFPSRPPLTLSLRARASSDSVPGTWGFGLWNDPFGLSLGFGGNPFRLPVLPNAAWFFHASEENWLSFGGPSTSGFDTPSKNTRATQPSAPPSGISQGEVGNGFLAQTFRSPAFDARLIPAGLALPFSRKATRRWLGRVVGEEGVRLGVDSAQWHRYSLEWSPNRVAFEVDEVRVLETSVSPRPPLGLVIWMDNQFAAFTPEGRIGFGVLKNEGAWLEVEDLVLRVA
jgi:hypothetical protein